MEILQNEVVKLVPIDSSHIEGIFKAAADPRIWEHMSVELLRMENVIKYVEDGIKKREAQTDFVFVIIDQSTGEIVGATSYMDISFQHKRLEIGSTWLNPSVWRTKINTNCKYLLLKYGFEQLRVNRIQIKTGHENIRSQKAIERIGAVKEGILRNHMIRKEGTIRHTVMYSITKEEWNQIKKRFEEILL
ncbi:RimJ/RimL family protein N-acetyltransferase OS=Ureibacillus acetophenoni OX=614649 GN=SAMN05877842_10969 PE=4 SV=1 [Ureibacillus acetophenoni]